MERGGGVCARVHLRITLRSLSCVRARGVERGVTDGRRLAGGFICRSVTWRNFVGKLRAASALEEFRNNTGTLYFVHGLRRCGRACRVCVYVFECDGRPIQIRDTVSPRRYAK